ncbi:hypothetical protein E2C01_090565 [Portunus trituberculatus]|uniref:Uncharacterized protein n=1 Tax=Portunus trituberculatus TaxID=210409 RepID=A0A5B7JQP9_PORTR|nr:hypothetical protein [Portunus trituberculatus]
MKHRMSHQYRPSGGIGVRGGRYRD